MGMSVYYFKCSNCNSFFAPAESLGLYASGHYFGSPAFTEGGLCGGAAWMQTTHAVGFVTPPPERNEATYAGYPPFAVHASAEFYMQASSLAETPLSSPSSEFATLSLNREETERCIARARSPLARFQLTAQESSSGEEETATAMFNAIPEGVKMPQRKGGMQLWQFLYALLTDPEKYGNLIEWTANAKLKEFRMLQPEAIAIWWGHHKNKLNMSYDKFSRSLRYYYERGLIRKITGERFVYRFCIDPELMYKHIGNFDARPILKPMPDAAKEAITNTHGAGTCTSALVAKPPVSVSLTAPSSAASTDSHNSVSLPQRAPPPYPYNNPPFPLELSLPVSSGNYFPDSVSIRRCHSLKAEPGYSRMASSNPEPHPLHMSSSYPNLHTADSYCCQSPEMSPPAQYSPPSSGYMDFSELTSLPQSTGYELDNYASSTVYCVADSTTPATGMWSFTQ